MIGLFAASFSSLLGNATLGGAVLADTFSLGNKLSSLPLRLLIMVVIITGAVIAIAFNHLQLNLIIIAQSLTMIVAPLIGMFILLISSNKNLMGDLRNNRYLLFFGILGLAVVVILDLGFVYLIFLK
jgi:Mn2+/Fe2+ NRAMP family transporter